MKKQIVWASSAILIVVIGLFVWKTSATNPAATDNAMAETKINAAKSVVSDGVAIQKVAAAATPVVASVGTVASVVAGAGYFYDIDGDVSITTGHAPAHRAAKSDTVVSDTVVTVGHNGYAILLFDDEQIVYLQPDTTLQVRDYRFDNKQAGNSNIDFNLSRGGVRLVTGKIGQQNHQAFKLSTPSGMIDVRGTEFSVVVDDKDKKSVYTSVVSGGIGMTNTAGTTVTTAGQFARTASADAPTAVIPAEAVPANTFKPLNSLAEKSGLSKGAADQSIRIHQGKANVAQKSKEPTLAGKNPNVKLVSMSGAVAQNTTGSAATVIAAGDTKAVAVKPSGGYLNEVVGDVTIMVGKGAPRQAANNDFVASDSVLTTGEHSRAMLKFDDGQVVVMQSDSALHVRAYHYEAERAAENNVDLSMLKGGMRFVTGMIGQLNKKAFKLETPNCTVGIRGTDFMLAMTNNGLYNQVTSGAISLTNDAGMLVVGAGQAAVVASAGTLATLIPVASLPAGVFSGVSAISAPAGGIAGSSAGGAAGGAAGGEAAGGATAGGAATGGGVIAGMSATTIGLGVGAAAVVAAVVSSGSTTHH